MQSPEEGQRDDALPGTGPARDDDDLLVVGLLRLADRAQHQLVGDPLFVQQNELLALADLFGGDRHQLLGRGHLAREQLVRRVGAGDRLQLRLEVLDELPAALVGEEPAALACGTS